MFSSRSFFFGGFFSKTVFFVLRRVSFFQMVCFFRWFVFFKGFFFQRFFFCKELLFLQGVVFFLNGVVFFFQGVVSDIHVTCVHQSLHSSSVDVLSQEMMCHLSW